MTERTPDPQPEETPGLEQGGSVRPGDTPPAESSTSDLGEKQPSLPGSGANKLVYGIVIGLAVVVVVMFGAYAVSLF